MNERTFRTTGGLGSLEDEEVLEACRTDPVHRMASIQPHGSFLEIDPANRKILSAAPNLEDYLGMPVREALHRSVDGLFPDGALPPAERWPAKDGPVRTRFAVGATDEPLMATLFPTGGTIGCEVERSSASGRIPESLLLDVQPRLADLGNQPDEEELFGATVRLVRSISEFDRVMLYRFGEEGHGSVVAEDRVSHVDSYLGQHFPASDIPEPARRLYRKNGIRNIPDVGYEPVPVLGPEGERAREELDLTYSYLRGVPLVHRRYLENMGVGSSLSVPVMLGGQLWGMIACHGGEPHHLERARQSLCELVGHTLSQQIARLQAGAKDRRHLAVAGWRSRLGSRPDAEELFGRLEDERDELLGFLEAEGFLLQLDEARCWIADEGLREPAQDLLGPITDRLESEKRFSVRSVVGEIDDAWERSKQVSGFLAVRLGASNRHFCCWFRPEARETIRWGGDPRRPVEVDADGRLSPRNSFEEWTQQVAGRSEAWTDLDHFTAREVARCFDDLVVGIQGHRLREVNRQLEERNEALQRAKEDLEKSNDRRQELLEEMKELARTDDMTGLANRREIMRRLKSEIERARRYDNALSVVLLDLDRFKSVNDRFGHHVGDRVLRRLGALLDRYTRSPDVAGRYGGEEFLLVFPESGAEEAAEAAARLVEDVRGRRFQHEEQEFGLTCSAGVAQLGPSDEEAEELLHRADNALYQAKEKGRDRVVQS